MLFVAAIMVYFGQLAGNVLDNRAKNKVDNEQFQKDYAIIKGETFLKCLLWKINEYNTGSELA